MSYEDLIPLDADLWLLSPSCQPYTVLNPLAKGAEDPRAKSFIHLMEDVLPALVARQRHPAYMLVENVAGFEVKSLFIVTAYTHLASKTSSTRQRLLHSLHTHGYAIQEFLLTPLQFGIPNSRLRYYLLAKAKPRSFDCTDSIQVWRHIPGDGIDWSDPRAESDDSCESRTEVRAYLDDNQREGDCHIPDRVLEKWGRLFDIVKPSSKRTCCFTRGMSDAVCSSPEV